MGFSHGFYPQLLHIVVIIGGVTLQYIALLAYIPWDRHDSIQLSSYIPQECGPISLRIIGIYNPISGYIIITSMILSMKRYDK